MELYSSLEGKSQQIQQDKSQKGYSISNFKYPDTFQNNSQRDVSGENPSKKPINYCLEPQYFTIDDKNSDFRKEINPQFKCNILICRGCDLLIGYKSFIVAKEKHFMTLSALLNYKIDPEADDDCFLNVFCMGCNEELGIKVKNSYYIYSAMVCEKNRIITVAIISLKKDLNDEFEKLLKTVNQQLHLQITIHHFHLQKSQLHNFKLQFNYDICIIIHKEEGRLLLFDDNGIYNHLYRECFANTKGNVLFILLISDYHSTPVSSNQPINQSNQANSSNNIQYSNLNNPINQNSNINQNILNHQLTQSTNDLQSQDTNSIQSQDSTDKRFSVSEKRSAQNQNQENAYSQQNPVWDRNLIKDISENGKQPLLYLLSKNQLVITIHKQINISQINFLMNFLHNSQYKPLVPGELKFALDFTKRYLKIKIDKCQSAIFSYFMEEQEYNPEYNEVIKQLSQQNQELENQRLPKTIINNDNNTSPQLNNNIESEKNQKCTIF